MKKKYRMVRQGTDYFVLQQQFLFIWVTLFGCVGTEAEARKRFRDYIDKDEADAAVRGMVYKL